MATTAKKRGDAESKMGRPKRGTLSSYPAALVEGIKDLRMENPGWGAISILIELEEEYSYSKSSLPSVASVNRYLNHCGLVKIYEPKGLLPEKPCKRAEAVHELWEMDAQGALAVQGIGFQALINMKDSYSRKLCISFPISVKNCNSQPATVHYKWAFRLAFLESGLPQRVQVDKDSVFIENSSKSPFPSRLHLWLVALGIELCFIKVAPPQKQAMVERSHQTMQRQAIQGKHYDSWQQFFQNCNKRRKRMNEKFPNSSLAGKTVMQAFPQAAHSGCEYSLEKEAALLDLKRIYHFLAQGKWYRKVSLGKMISLGGHRYYLRKATPKTQLQITFCMQSKQFIFRDVNELLVDQSPIKGISKRELMNANNKDLLSMYKKLSGVSAFPLLP